MEAQCVLIPIDGYDKHYIRREYWSVRDLRWNSYQLDARPIGVVGGVPVLYNEYHEDQLWLPCCALVLARSPPTPDERKRNAYRDTSDWARMRDSEQYRRQIEQRINNPPMVRDEDRYFYRMHEYACFQAFLPFVEIQECTQREYTVVRTTWDRYGDPPPIRPIGLSFHRMTSKQRALYRDEREPLELPVDTTQSEYRDWLVANIAGRFYFNGAKVVFERYPDWVHARLRFSGEE